MSSSEESVLDSGMCRIQQTNFVPDCAGMIRVSKVREQVVPQQVTGPQLVFSLKKCSVFLAVALHRPDHGVSVASVDWLHLT